MRAGAGLGVLPRRAVSQELREGSMKQSQAFVDTLQAPPVRSEPPRPVRLQRSSTRPAGNRTPRMMYTLAHDVIRAFGGQVVRRYAGRPSRVVSS
jgi:hypothetical protein